MAKYRHVYTSFWQDPKVIEEMTPEDKLFYLYLLTNPSTKQIGIYQLTRKQMAFELGYSLESINALLERFVNHHKVIQYDYDTREVCMVNWGRYNFIKGGKPVEDCIRKELREVKNQDFIKIVYDRIESEKIKTIFDEYFDEVALRDTSRDTIRDTLRGQKEKQKQKENKKEKEKQKQSVRIDDVVEQETDVSKVLYEYLTNISLGDIEDINKALAAKNRDVNYLREKLEIMQHIRDIKYPVKYLLKAIEDDYRSYGKSEVKGGSSRNKFKNFDETVTKYSSDELEEKIRQSQSKKFG